MMTKNIKEIVFWMPLVVGVLLAAIVGYFALHIWGRDHGILEALLNVFLQILPGILLVLEIALAWRKKWFGVVFFLAFAGWSLLAASLPGTANPVLTWLGK